MASLSAPTPVAAGFLAVLAGVPDMDSISYCCAILLTFSGIPVPAVVGFFAVAGFPALAGALLVPLTSLPAY
jgi:hypothetical protein